MTDIPMPIESEDRARRLGYDGPQCPSCRRRTLVTGISIFGGPRRTVCVGCGQEARP